MTVYTGHDCIVPAMVTGSTDYDGYILITVLTTAVLTEAMINIRVYLSYGCPATFPIIYAFQAVPAQHR